MFAHRKNCLKIVYEKILEYQDFMLISITLASPCYCGMENPVYKGKLEIVLMYFSNL